MNPNQDVLFNRARLPANHRGCLLSRIPDLPYKSKIADYTENIREYVTQGRGLYLWGSYGTGKTAIACIVCKAALSRGLVPLWVTAESIPAYMVEDIFFDDEILMRDRMYSVDLLVIDDFRMRDQKAAKSDWIERWFENLIRRRLDAKKATIVTSNTSKFELKKLKAVYSITSEAMEFVEIAGHDFRSEIIENR